MLSACPVSWRGRAGLRSPTLARGGGISGLKVLPGWRMRMKNKDCNLLSMAWGL